MVSLCCSPSLQRLCSSNGPFYSPTFLQRVYFLRFKLLNSYENSSSFIFVSYFSGHRSKSVALCLIPCIYFCPFISLLRRLACGYARDRLALQYLSPSLRKNTLYDHQHVCQETIKVRKKHHKSAIST
jgi:hypothetical protein